MTFDDNQLRAYLAGDMPEEAARALEEQLEGDAILEARLLELDQASHEVLRQVMTELPGQERLRRLEADLTTAEPVKTRPVWAMAAVAAFVAFGLGAFIFGTQRSAVPHRWQEQVAIYQALYVTETLTPIRFEQDVIAAQVKRSGTELGRDIPFEAVSRLDALTLKRAQILGFEGAPLIQLAYLSETGAPVALCAVRLDGSETADVVFETLAGLPSAHWSRDGVGYMLIGDLAAEHLQDLAEELQRTL